MADQQQPGGGEQQPAQALWPTAYGQAASFKFQHIPPPSESYFSLNDRLIIRVSDPYFQLPTLTIAGRVLRMDGQIIPFSEDFKVIAGGYGPIEFGVQVGEGFLLNVGVHAAPKDSNIGKIYVQILRTLSVGATQVVICPMVCGYINSYVPLGWPPINYQEPGSGPGDSDRFITPAPAAGQEAVFNLSGGQRMRVFAISATLTTSAAVANRVVSFVGFRAGELFRTTASAAQPASTTQLYVAMPGIAAPYQNTVGNQVRNFLPLPVGLVVNNFWRISTATDNLQPGDQWSALTVTGEEWAVDL